MDSNGRGSCLRVRKAGGVKISKDSHMITKSNSGSSSSSSSMNDSPKDQPLPLIRVIHIFNPTVIKTDAANFRSLVQKLTGKSFKSRRSSKSSHTTKETSRAPVKSDNGSTTPMSSPTGFEGQFPHEFPRECKQSNDLQLGCFTNFGKDPFLGAPFFDTTASEYDGKAQLFDLGEDNSLSEADAMKVGIFSELDIVSGLGSPESLPDCSMLPSLNGMIDQEMRSPVHRLSSFYNSFETF